MSDAINHIQNVCRFVVLNSVKPSQHFQNDRSLCYLNTLSKFTYYLEMKIIGLDNNFLDRNVCCQF
jgi:hypothetical protein